MHFRAIRERNLLKNSLFENCFQQTLHLYSKRNTETGSCNHCCSGKVINITQSECVFLDLDI